SLLIPFCVTESQCAVSSLPMIATVPAVRLIQWSFHDLDRRPASRYRGGHRAGNQERRSRFDRIPKIPQRCRHNFKRQSVRRRENWAFCVVIGGCRLLACCALLAT